MPTHPLIAAARDLAPTISAAAETIESAGRVPDSIVDALHDAGFFRAAVPREFGGDEVSPLLLHEAVIELAKADASTAWITIIIYCNPYLLGNSISSNVWETVFGNNPDCRTAGNIAPNGRAEVVDGGYQITGHWKYGSGSEHCEYLMSGCVVYDGQSPRVAADGQPERCWMLHATKDCRILTDTWDATGLRGTGSHDYVIEQPLFVPQEWSFLIGNTVHALNSPLYTFIGIPFHNLGAVALGMARAALDYVTELAKTKRRGPLFMREDPAVQMRIAEAEGLWGSGRTYLLRTLTDLLATLESGGPSLRQRGLYRVACTNAFDSAVRIVDSMYKIAGGAAVIRGNPLERIFRDIHTAATHIQVNDLSYVKSGRLLLGLDPQDPLF